MRQAKGNSMVLTGGAIQTRKSIHSNTVLTEVLTQRRGDHWKGFEAVGRLNRWTKRWCYSIKAQSYSYVWTMEELVIQISGQAESVESVENDHGILSPRLEHQVQTANFMVNFLI